jgi:hypothetical protein
VRRSRRETSDRHSRCSSRSRSRSSACRPGRVRARKSVKKDGVGLEQRAPVARARAGSISSGGRANRSRPLPPCSPTACALALYFVRASLGPTVQPQEEQWGRSAASDRIGCAAAGSGGHSDTTTTTTDFNRCTCGCQLQQQHMGPVPCASASWRTHGRCAADNAKVVRSGNWPSRARAGLPAARESGKAPGPSTFVFSIAGASCRRTL